MQGLTSPDYGCVAPTGLFGLLFIIGRGLHRLPTEAIAPTGLCLPGLGLPGSALGRCPRRSRPTVNKVSSLQDGLDTAIQRFPQLSLLAFHPAYRPLERVACGG